MDPFEQARATPKIVDPDIAPVDDARRQPLVGREAVLRDQIEISLPTHEIESKAIDRQCRQRRVGVADVPEAVWTSSLAAPLTAANGCRRRSTARAHQPCGRARAPTRRTESNPRPASESRRHFFIHRQQPVEKLARSEDPPAGFESSRKLTGPIRAPWPDRLRPAPRPARRMAFPTTA